MKKFLSFFLILTFLFTKCAYAAENKYGIHILDPSDLDKASQLVNSSGGDWGYVTIVIRDDDLNKDKWQGFMDRCRELHLIPLVRLATHLEKDIWAKPKVEDAQKWADFLNSLNWPVNDQLVIIFNEPNQTKEWGGEVDPKGYAKILNEFIKVLKNKNEDIKILNAGLDLAAGNTKTTMEAFKFMEEMNWETPGIFEKLDGWASHSYPNHGYLGKPWDTGKTSIRGFEWELKILKNNFKVKKDLPVFITETGWPKSLQPVKGKKITKSQKANKYYDEITVSNYLKSAFENVWLKEERIKAITPFLLNYPGDLFKDFSWLDQEGNPYKQFELVKSLKKENWWPDQTETYIVSKVDLPPFFLTNSSFKGSLVLKNLGQSILGEKEEFIVKPITSSKNIFISEIVLPNKQTLKPNDFVKLEFEIKTSEKEGEYTFSWGNPDKYKIKVLKRTILTKSGLTFWEKILSKLRFW